MGERAWLVKYEETDIPRNREFHDMLRGYFSNEDGSITIGTEYWNETKENHPEWKEQYPEEIAALEKLLRENDDSIELSFS